MDTEAGTIVVGTDGSESSKRALAWATSQAVAEHRELTLVHTIEAATPAYLDAAAVFPTTARDALNVAGQAVLDDARAEVERTAPGLEVHEVLAFEDPRQTLLDLSRDAAMVVLGSRGRGRLRSLLLGSVGGALVRHAGCPVVVHRLGNPGVVRNGIVVGADGSEESRVVLEFAYREASLRSLPLTVLHCYWDVQAGTAAAYIANELEADLASERLLLSESMAGLGQKYPDVVVRVEMAGGLPQEALVRMGERMNLIVVGAHHSGRLSRMLFGSVSISVVEHATCPVAVVPLVTAG